MTFLRVLAQDSERREEILERAFRFIGPEDFKDEVDRTILQLFADTPDLKAVPAGLNPTVASRMEELLAAPTREGQFDHATQSADDAIRALRAKRLGREIDDLQGRIEATTDEEEKLRLTLEKTRLHQEKRELGPVGTGDYARRHARRPKSTD